ncbi:MAG: Uma2 family endonuclease, partial [Clostridia bacterium]|nr:Uma2 family endonuclease [Deltaproteobacteria bacterium]
RGLEPDECYIIGNRKKTRPDLAIEVIWTSAILDKLEIYRGLDVREVWLVRDGVVEAHELVDGSYKRVTHSIAFPKLDLTLVMQLLDEPTMSDAMRKMQTWARARL